MVYIGEVPMSKVATNTNLKLPTTTFNKTENIFMSVTARFYVATRLIQKSLDEFELSLD